ncbi:hypothetical protein H0H93_005399 [Arthromyces matolae]|nr:hypothetical protein H0H93_005399 [Arthromyces matolae]
MRFSALFVVSFAFSALARPHDSVSLVQKRHNRRSLEPSSASNLTLRDEGNVLQKRFGPGVRFSYYAPGLDCCSEPPSEGFEAAGLSMFANSHFKQFGNGEDCFKEITMSYGGKSTQATIVDECMECPYGALDLSPGLFNYFGSEAAGYLYGSWEFGSGAPATTSKAPEPSTTTKAKPTSTWTPQPSTSSTSTKKTSSSAASQSSTSTSASSTSTSASSSASATPSATPGPADLFDEMNAVYSNLGVILIGAILTGAAPALVTAKSHGSHHNRHVEIAKRQVGDVQLFKRYSNARWTFYDVGLGACGKNNVASDFIVALNSAQFGSGYPGPYCFKTITMSYNGKSTQATIMDECPGCPEGGLDLSRGLFTFFAPESVGVLYGTWTLDDGSSGDDAPTTSHYVAPKTTSTPHTTQKPSTTWTPPPSSTWTPDPTTSSTKKSSSSSSSSSQSASSSAVLSSSSSKRSSSTSATATSSAASSSASASQSGTNLASLAQAFLDVGVLAVAAAD